MRQQVIAQQEAQRIVDQKAETPTLNTMTASADASSAVVTETDSPSD